MYGRPGRGDGTLTKINWLKMMSLNKNTRTSSLARACVLFAGAYTDDMAK